MSICLLPEKVKEFRKALKDRTLDLNKLFDEQTTTEQRVEVFKQFAGENAGDVTKLFESKLILKNKVLGIENAINKLGEMGRYNPLKKAELTQALSEYKHAQQERVLNPNENQTFLNTLADKILGTEVTKAEAQQAFDLSAKSDELFKNYDPTKEIWSSPEVGAEYGASKQIYQKFIDNLKNGELSIKGMMKEYSQETKNLWKEDRLKAIAKIVGESIFNLSKNMINAVASWDNSFIGRQGSITLIKSPSTWWNMAKKSTSDFYQTLKGSSPEDVLMAQVYADPDFINGNYKKAGISFGIEEEVPSKLLERVPVVGRIFKASDVSFIDSAIRARTGLFKIQKQIYEATGMPLDDVTLKDIGNVVNAITARGKVGAIGSSKPVQLLMWAPRMLKADWDVLTAHTAGFGLETNFARKQAAKTVLGVVVATAGITAMAKAMGAQVETDPRSSDFLKIKIGDTRINTPFARGMPQLITLFSRLVTQSTKSSSTGVIRQLNTGEYGSQTLFDVGIDFLVNKTTPPAGAVISWLRGKDFKGDKPTIGGTAFGFLPISIQNFIGLKDNPTTQSVIGAFVDLFGVSSNTYSSTETDWKQGQGVEIKAFQKKVGEVRFKEANDKYNTQVASWLKSVKADPRFHALSEDDKQKVITNKKGDIKDKIFAQYGFKYRIVKSKPLPKL